MSRSMVKRFTLLITAIILFTSSYAQQDPQYSFNMFNHMSINPGFAGSNDAICANGIYRNQWSGFEGHPETMVFNAHMPIKGISSGVGLSVLNDKVGYESSLNLKLSYSYMLNLDDAGMLGIGLSVGMMQKALDAEWETYNSLENGNTDPYADPAVPPSDSHISFDMDFGLFYKINLEDNMLYAGLSTTHITEPKVKLESSAASFIKRHYYLTAGYYYTLPAQQWELRPSFLIKSDGTTAQYSVNSLLIYEKKYWGGLTYRFTNDVVFMAGVQLPMNLNIGFAYDLGMSKYSSYQGHTFEVMLKYCFNVSSNNGTTRNKSVRFL